MDKRFDRMVAPGRVPKKPGTDGAREAGCHCPDGTLVLCINCPLKYGDYIPASHRPGEPMIKGYS